jgi:hypothetical protein
MLDKLPLAPIALLGMIAAAPALAEGWDHRAMQSHHQAADRRAPQLAPGEQRIGRILIGTAASQPSAQVPETLESATQRQWIQRHSFSEASPAPAASTPRIQAGRHDGTPGVSHRSPSR